MDKALEGLPLADLQAAAERLSMRYRSEIRDGRAHLSDDLSARAYLAVRMPATYAAVRASLAAVAQLRPDFMPKSLLDAGAGPGTALFAARDCWPSLSDATLIENSPVIRRWGEALVSELAIGHIDWRASDLASRMSPQALHDLVVLTYVLDELPPAAIGPLIEQLWQATGDTIIVVEPGTPAGWSRILSVRDRLIARRRSSGGAVPACVCLSACGARLVPLLAPGCALANASPDQVRRRAVGGREVHLHRRVPPSAPAGGSAGDRAGSGAGRNRGHEVVRADRCCAPERPVKAGWRAISGGPAPCMGGLRGGACHNPL